MKKVKWTENQVKYLVKNYADTDNAVLAKYFRCNLHRISNKAYALGLKKSLAYRQEQAKRMIPAGAAYRFKKGHIPVNKGRKGWYPPGCEKNWFKKGHKPHNYKTGEFLSKDGYVVMSIGEGKQKLKHIYNWEQLNGPLPKGHCLNFLDGDRTNTNVENLELITRAELLRRNMLSDSCIAKKQLGATSDKDVATLKKIAPQLIKIKRNELLIKEKLKK